MDGIPKNAALDSTIALLSEGYTFIARRCERLETDAFETRLMLRRAICTTGAEAARMFYHPGRFTRKKAMPPTTLRLLQDKGSVQLQDGESHRHRKRMFMSLMKPESVSELVRLMAEEWRAAVPSWKRGGEIVLHDRVQEVLCRAVCRWVDIPLSDDEARRRTREFSAMIDGAGAVGPRNWRGLLLRSRTESWLRELVRDARQKPPRDRATTPFDTVVWHRHRQGELLDVEVAAVEIANLLRPTVAVARYVMFAALALHEHPDARPTDGAYEPFVQEVRRFYPFFPFVGGRVREPFSWRGRSFDEGTWVLLDLYSTNRDPRIWNDPESFLPDRFVGWEGDPFRLIPQGAGGHADTHRCAGEWITIELMKEAVRLLVEEMEYVVPEDQDLTIDLSRMPAQPESRVRIRVR